MAGFSVIILELSKQWQVYTLRSLELLVKTNNKPITWLKVNAFGHVDVKLEVELAQGKKVSGFYPAIFNGLFFISHLSSGVT